jgi:tetratricopeptide (TPR) repeat protein
MNMKLQNIISGLQAAIFSTFMFLLLCSPLTSYASGLIYTIQTGSFNTADDAQKHFNSIVTKLNKENLDNLRIEKIGDFFSVRIGKYEGYSIAVKSFQKIKPQLSDTFIMEAYFKDERIIKIYKGPSPVDGQRTEGAHLTKTVSEVEAKPVEAEKEEDEVVPPDIEVQPEVPAVSAANADEELPAKPMEKQTGAMPDEEEYEEHDEAPEVIKQDIEERPDVPSVLFVKEDRVAQLTPIEWQIRTISGLVAKGEYKEALKVLEAEIEVRPEVPMINGWYGTVLLKLERPADAVIYLRKAAELSPGISDYHNGIAYCLFYLEEFDEAIIEFDKALTINPSYIDALVGMGITYSRLGELSLAMDVYYKLEKIDSDTADKLLGIIQGT